MLEIIGIGVFVVSVIAYLAQDIFSGEGTKK